MNFLKAFRAKHPSLSIDLACVSERGDKIIKQGFLETADSYLGIVNSLKTPFWKKQPSFDFIFLNTIVGGEIINRVKPWSEIIFSWILERPPTIRLYGDHLLKNLCDHSTHLLAFDAYTLNYIKLNCDTPASLLRAFVPATDSSFISDSLPSSPSSKIKIGFIASPVWRKGGFDLPKISSRLTSDLEIVLMGFEPSSSAAAQLMYHFDLVEQTDRYRFFGTYNNFSELLSEFDVHLCLAHEETGPLTILESALLEKPSIVWNKGSGLSDFVADGAGWVVPYQDFDALAELLNGLSNNRAEIAKRGRRAREKVLAEFTAEVRVREFIEVLRGLGLSV